MPNICQLQGWQPKFVSSVNFQQVIVYNLLCRELLLSRAFHRSTRISTPKPPKPRFSQGRKAVARDAGKKTP